MLLLNITSFFLHLPSGVSRTLGTIYHPEFPPTAGIYHNSCMHIAHAHAHANMYTGFSWTLPD